MSLERWFENGWLHPHQPSPKEIAELLEVAGRALADARVEGLLSGAKSLPEPLRSGQALRSLRFLNEVKVSGELVSPCPSTRCPRRRPPEIRLRSPRGCVVPSRPQ
jgi:hypothetical protein